MDEFEYRSHQFTYSSGKVLSVRVQLGPRKAKSGFWPYNAVLRTSFFHAARFADNQQCQQSLQCVGFLLLNVKRNNRIRALNSWFSCIVWLDIVRSKFHWWEDINL